MCSLILHDKLESFLRKILSKFLKVSVLKDLDDVQKLVDCDFGSVENQLDNTKIFVGFVTRQILHRILHDGDINNSEVKKLYNGVKHFYTKTTEYCYIPLERCHASMLDIEKRISAGFDSIEYFVHHFPHLCELTTPGEMDLLQEEFISYQLLNDSDIPDEVWSKAKISEDESAYYCIDVLWG